MAIWTAESDDKPSEDAIKTQYTKLGEDWRQLNSMLWSIPSAAVAIMAGMVVVAYQPELNGPPRIVLLITGCIFLLALTLEVLKKALFMTVITDKLKTLQGKKGLQLKECTQFIPDPKSVPEYSDKISVPYPKILEPALRSLHKGTRHGRAFLACVVFVAAISVGLETFSWLHLIPTYHNVPTRATLHLVNVTGNITEPTFGSHKLF